MLKRLMTILLSATMMLSSIGVTFAQEDAAHPLVEDAVYYLGEISSDNIISKEALQSTSGHIITSVKVNNPGSDGATAATLIVTLSDKSTGKIIETAKDTQSVTATTEEITLSKGIDYNCSVQKLDYYVVDQDGASLRNAPPMPVEEIRYSAKIKYVKLDWDIPKDDFSSVKEYIIKRDGVEIGRTDKNTFVDPADGERDGVTLTYGITAVDHGGLLSEEKTVTLTTPSYATAYLMPTEEETREKSSGLNFVYVDNKTTDVYGQDISTLGGKHTDVNGKELAYRNTVHWLNGSTDRTTYMLFSVDSQIIEDDDNEVTIEVTYLDKGTHKLKFQYYRTENLGQYGLDTPLTDSGEWKTLKLERTNFSRPLGEAGYNNNNCSFRLVSADTKEEIYISKVRIIPTEDIGNDLKELLYPSDPALGAFVTFGANEDEDRENCMKFYYADWNELAPTEQQSERIYYNGEWCRKTAEYLDKGVQRISYLNYKIDAQILPERDNHVKISIRHYNDGTPIKVKYFKPDGSKGSKSVNATPDPATIGTWTTTVVDIPNFSIADEDVSDGWKPTGQFNISSNATWGEGKVLYVSSVKVEKVGNETAPDTPDTPDTPDEPAGDPTQGAWITFGETQAEDTSNCMNFHYSEWDAENPTEQQSSSVVYEGVGSRRTYSLTASDNSTRNTQLLFKIASSVLGDNDNNVKMTIKYYNDGQTPLRIKYFSPDGQKNFKIDPDSENIGWRTVTKELTDFSIKDEHIPDGWKPLGQFNIYSDVLNSPIYVASVKVEKVGTQIPEEPAGDPSLGGIYTFGENADIINCMEFYCADWNESSPTEQQSTLMQYNGEWCRRTYEYQTGETQRRTYLNYKVDSTVLTERDNHVKISITHYNDGTPIKVKYFKPDGSKSSKQINVTPDASTLNSWTTTVVEIENFSIADEDVSDGWKPIGQFNISSNATWGEGKVLYVSSVKVEKVSNETVEPDTPTESITVFMAGDSIAQHQAESAYPKSGWFQHLEKFFDSSVAFDNRALGGMSARSFRERKVDSSGVEDENGTAPWTSLLADAQEGDYVLISFAHNDSVTSKTEDYTDPALSMDAEFGENGKASYRYYLKKYVEEARAKGVNPIFVTAVESHQTLGDYDPPQFKSYADAMVETGESLNVPVLNINQATAQLYTSYGAVNDKVFFRLITATDLGSKPMSDGVHLRDYGALHVANLFRKLLSETSCELKNNLLNTYSQPASVFVDDRFRSDITLAERSGKYLVPAVKVLEGIDATEIVSDATSFSAKVRIPNNDPTQEAVYDEKVVSATVGSMSYAVGGATVVKDYAPELIDGSIYINPAFFEDICGGNVYYDEFMKMTTILTGINESAMPFVETFDGFIGSKTSNVYPAGWESGYFVANQSYMIGETTTGSNNEAVKLVRENADTSLPYYLIHDFEYTSSQVFTMRVKTTDIASRKDIRLWVNDSSKGGSAFVIAAKLADGKISGPNSVTVNPYTLTADEWVTLKFIVVIVDDENNITTNMFTYVVDENEEETFIGNYQVPYSTGMIEGVRFEMHTGTNDALYVDDFEVKAYTGGFPSIPSPDEPDEPVEDPTLGAWVTFGATAAEDDTNCMTYTADTDCSNTTYEGKASIRMPHKNSSGSRNYIYFALDDEVLGNSTAANVTVTYYDAGVSPRLEYYNSDNASKNPVLDTSPNNSGWKTVTLTVEDLPVTERSGWSGQFRIRSNSGDNPTLDSIYIADIKVEKVDADDPTLGAWVAFGSTAADDDTNCMEYTYDTTDANCCTSTTYEEKTCVKMPHLTSSGNSRNYIYLTVDSDVLGESSKANLSVTYYDAGVSPRLEYYNTEGDYKNPVIDENADGCGWKTVTLTVDDLSLTNAPGGWPGQMRIRSNSETGETTEAIYIAQIWVEPFTAPQIWMAGDSLSAPYRDDQRPQTGWMEVFASKYAADLTVQNRAIGGESSKSFYDRGYLTNILNSAKRGDYLFIQFSHNDTHEGTDNEYRHTDPGNWSDETKTTWVPSTYEEYMEKYVKEAKAAGINPVILTSVAWARYVDGEFDGRAYRNLERYADGARYVAQKHGIPLVEVFEPTCEYHENATSEEDHKYYYMYVELCSAETEDECANKVRHSDWDHTWCTNFSEAKADNVHVNHKGAAWIADIVAEGISTLNLPIAEYLTQSN